MSDTTPKPPVFAAIMKAKLAMTSGSPTQPEEFICELERQGYTIVAAYDADRSLMHPIDRVGLHEIWHAFEKASKKHGFLETWMAVYNECVTQGEIANPAEIYKP